MFTMVYFVREMIAKKSPKYGKYGSFEHLLFLSFVAASRSGMVLFFLLVDKLFIIFNPKFFQKDSIVLLSYTNLLQSYI